MSQEPQGHLETSLGIGGHAGLRRPEKQLKTELKDHQVSQFPATLPVQGPCSGISADIWFGFGVPKFRYLCRYRFRFWPPYVQVPVHAQEGDSR